MCTTTNAIVKTIWQTQSRGYTPTRNRSLGHDIFSTYDLPGNTIDMFLLIPSGLLCYHLVILSWYYRLVFLLGCHRSNIKLNLLKEKKLHFVDIKERLVLSCYQYSNHLILWISYALALYPSITSPFPFRVFYMLHFFLYLTV